MLKLPIDILQPGMTLAKPITDDRGRTLLRQGITLTDEYISVLKQRDLTNAFIAAEDTSDIVIDSFVTENTHTFARQKLAAVFDFVCNIAAPSAGANDISAEEVTADSGVAEALRSSAEFNQLEPAVLALLADVADKKTVANLSQIRRRSDLQFAHAVNVAAVGMFVGKLLHLSETDLIRLGTACMLHDIGKIFFHPTLLHVNGQPPNPAQMLKIRDHTRLGYELLRKRDPENVMVNHVALEHHERQDGKGYPRGLRGTNTIERARFSRDNIMLITEITTLADTFDILSNAAPQRPALSPKQIAQTLQQLAGTFLNKELVEIFLSAMPLLPKGINIVVRAGRYANYKGVVIEHNPQHPQRPVIRLLFNPLGNRVSPINLNLAQKEDMIVEATL
ncbi:MAG: HD domain-containing protein [Chloroflexi bacterium]|nr:MAG: HD domain-containing protein [Chloroflexota bacterium]